MFDGVNIRKQTNEEQARYWGRKIGLQGFFVNRLMGQWQNDVGADASSPLWDLARRFQTLYAREGVTDNFVKVAIWKRHDWRDAQANRAVVTHFAHAAALARHAGFRGVALDLEPYVPIWGGAAGGSRVAGTVNRTGKAIGKAMHDAAPGMTLVLLQDALYWLRRGQGYHGGYELAAPFLRGLLSTPFHRVVLAVEGPSYAVDPDLAAIVADARHTWDAFIRKHELPVKDFAVAPGLWPLGHSYTDKSARMTPGQFASALEEADAISPDYVWIYGFGSAWQSDGPYGNGPVTKNFAQYLDVLRQRRARCGLQ